MMFIKTHGIVQHYVAEGSKDKPVLVFANSLGSDLRIWDGVVTHLADDFRIIRYDKRGHGLSDVPTPPYSLDDFAGSSGVMVWKSKGGRLWTVGWGHCPGLRDQLP
jgi:3-oxoadipate enol-lactonase